jgi:hypothetical protein
MDKATKLEIIISTVKQNIRLIEEKRGNLENNEGSVNKQPASSEGMQNNRETTVSEKENTEKG